MVLVVHLLVFVSVPKQHLIHFKYPRVLVIKHTILNMSNQTDRTRTTTAYVHIQYFLGHSLCLIDPLGRHIYSKCNWITLYVLNFVIISVKLDQTLIINHKFYFPKSRKIMQISKFSANYQDHYF